MRMIAELEMKQPVSVSNYAKFQSVIFELLYKADPSIFLHGRTNVREGQT